MKPCFLLLRQNCPGQRNKAPWVRIVVESQDNPAVQDTLRINDLLIVSELYLRISVLVSYCFLFLNYVDAKLLAFKINKKCWGLYRRLCLYDIMAKIWMQSFKEMKDLETIPVVYNTTVLWFIFAFILWLWKKWVLGK